MSLPPHPGREGTRASAANLSAVAPAWQQTVGVTGLILVLLSLAVRYTILVQPRAMEFDQFCTLVAAEAHSWRAYMAAATVDSQPPWSHLAARIGLALPLPQNIGVHIFSALAMMLTAFCLFRVLQRRGAPLAGLCAAAFFTASRCVEFMYTLRPYAALMAISALGVLVYDTYRRRREVGQRATLWPLALVIVFAATIHALSLVYVLAPVVAGELLYWWQTRRIDKRLLTAAGLASTAFLFDFALAREIQTKYMSLIPPSARLPGRPTAAKLAQLLTFFLERRWQVLIFVAVLAGTLVFSFRARKQRPPEAPRTPDLLYLFLAAAAVYLAAVMAFCMGVVNHYFYTRYASPVFVSGALLLGAILALAPWRRLPVVPVGLSAVLLVLPLPALRSALQPGASLSPRADFAAIFGHGDIVASPLAGPMIWWYATPQERAHMQVLTDPDRYRNLPDGLPEVNLRQFAAAGVLPFPLTPLQNYHPGEDVYLVRTNPSGDVWLPALLESQGYACGAEPGFHSDVYAMTHCARRKP